MKLGGGGSLLPGEATRILIGFESASISSDGNMSRTQSCDWQNFDFGSLYVVIECLSEKQ